LRVGRGWTEKRKKESTRRADGVGGRNFLEQYSTKSLCREKIGKGKEREIRRMRVMAGKGAPKKKEDVWWVIVRPTKDPKGNNFLKRTLCLRKARKEKEENAKEMKSIEKLKSAETRVDTYQYVDGTAKKGAWVRDRKRKKGGE